MYRTSMAIIRKVFQISIRFIVFFYASKSLSLLSLFMLVYFEIYGCQMNVNDADIIWSVLKSHGYKHTQCLNDADIVLLVTCSIRDNAEQKVWNKLENLNGIRNRRKRMIGKSMKIGLLGKLN